ncbi:MAG TPA: hypothetical protein VF517_13370 [Thermoleophilaceae bacterium]
MARTALVVLLFLAIATPAHAGGTVFSHPSPELYGDAVLAGERVVWVTRSESPDGIEFHRARVDGSDHAITHVAAPVNPSGGNRAFFAFDASARRLAAGLHLLRCTDCKYQSYESQFSRTLSGSLDGPLDEIARCSEGGGANPLPVDPRIAVSGDVVAVRSPCRTQITVYDLATSPPQTREYPGAFFFRVAGDFLASQDGDGVVVRNWRSGEEVLRLPDAAGFDLQPDGKLAFVARSGEQRPVMWASPASPVPREVAPHSAGATRIANDRIAHGRPGGGVTVRTLGGDVLADSAVARLGDFDGGQVAWAARVCTRVVVATWDLAGEPPVTPAGDCPLAALRSTTLRAWFAAVSAEHWATVKIVCPPDPPLGCEGSLALLAPDGRPRPKRRGLIDFARGSYRLEPGERATVRLDFVPGGLCAVRRNALRPIFHAGGHPLYAPPGARAKRRRVALVGVRSYVDRCEPRT